MERAAKKNVDVKSLAIAHLMRAVRCVHGGHPNQAVEHARKGYQYAVAWQTKVEKGNE